MKRIATIDGLRGFLAASVLIHHIAVYHVYLTTGLWVEPNQVFYGKLGAVSVEMFFIITGYLFWTQLLRKQGAPSWRALYISRVFRIGPVYLVAAISAISVILWKSHFELRVPLHTFAIGLARWLSLGLFQGESLNGFANAALLLAGVTWSLRYEWGFYFSLPVLAPMAQRGTKHTWFVLGLLFVYAIGINLVTRKYRLRLEHIDLFFLGMLIASLKYEPMQWEKKTASLSKQLGSTGIVICLAGAFVNHYSFLTHLLLGAALYLITSGSNLFGVLETRAAVRLGDISYGIYLLQGLVMATLFYFSKVRSLALGTPIGHWSVCLVCLVLTALFALVVHVFVERPGILLGKTLAERS